jgi:hypothetical protein
MADTSYLAYGLQLDGMPAIAAVLIDKSNAALEEFDHPSLERGLRLF